LFLRHQTMDKLQKHNSFNTNTPSSESYKNDCRRTLWPGQENLARFRSSRRSWV